MRAFNINQRLTRNRLNEFADYMVEYSKIAGFKMSARGWGYAMEGERMIDKSQIDKIETLINRCRKEGFLPIDFIAEEEARQFSGVEKPTTSSPEEFMRLYVEAALEAERYYTPDWWDGERYYIQMVVEKIDLKTLFQPVCKEYHIPIATSKGWSSMIQRAIYAKRFQEAKEGGLQPLLLYCGDHDPDGLRISNFLRKNLMDLKDIVWENGDCGYNPEDLMIERFGLNYDFIEKHKLTWIDNLITGSGGCIAKKLNGEIVQGRTKGGKPHPNFNLAYAQEYLDKYGVRKVEANAIAKIPDIAREWVKEVIETYLGVYAKHRFEKKRQVIKDQLDNFREKTGLGEALNKALDVIDKEK